MTHTVISAIHLISAYTDLIVAHEDDVAALALIERHLGRVVAALANLQSQDTVVSITKKAVLMVVGVIWPGVIDTDLVL